VSGFAIQTVGLTRRFGDVLAVDDLSLHVPRSSIYGFLGPNGAGKTTTIRMLLGLTRPDRGVLRLFNQLITPSNRRIALARVGATVETPSLYAHLTGYENLRITQGLLGLHRSNIERVLRIVRLEQDANHLVSAYSHGMRQRLGLALALLAEPDLIILDEPTNGLDPAGIQEMRDLILRFPSEHGVTVFLSSHLLAEVEQLASDIGIIGRGRLLFEGTLVELQRYRRARVVVGVDRPAVACAVLREAGWTALPTDTSGVTVDISEPSDIARAAAALVSAGLQLYQLQTVRPSLEDLFLELTSEAQLGGTSSPRRIVSR
jgi:lantibiotic transport system ATP-binding protein